MIWLWQYRTLVLSVSLAASITAGVLAYGAAQRRAGRIELERETTANTLQNVTAVRDSVVAVLVAHEARAQDSLAVLNEALARADAELAENEARRPPAEVVVARAGMSVDATLDSLIAKATPEIRPLAETLTIQVRGERSARQSLAAIDRRTIETQAERIAALEATVRVQAGQNRGLRDLNAALQASDEAARARIAVLEEQTGGPWYGGIVNVATHVGSFALGIWLATQIEGG